MKKQPQKVTKLKFKPAGDRVLVKPESQEDKKTASGIIIPDTAEKHSPMRGVVIAVGTTKTLLEPGDKVLFSTINYDSRECSEVQVEGEKHYLINEQNLLAITK